MSSTVKQSTFSISLPQMLDLTFGRPDIQSVNMKMLHNFLHLLLHLNGLDATIVNYEGGAADEMRALTSSSESDVRELDVNVAISAYKIRHSSCQKPRQNGKVDVFIGDDHLQCKIMNETKQEKIEFSVNNHPENALSAKSLEVDKMSVLTCKNIEQSSIMISREIPENHSCKRQAGGGDIAEEVSHMHKRMSQIENKISELNEHISSITSPTNESKNGQKSPNNLVITDSNKNIDSTSDKQSATVVSSNLSVKDESADKLELDILGDVNCCKLRTDVRTLLSALTEVKGDVCDLRGKVYEIKKSCENKKKDGDCRESSIKKCTIPSDTAAEENYLIIKQKQDSYKPTKCTDLICNVETSLTNRIECIDERMQNFEDYVNCSLKNINEIISKNKSEEELLRCVQGVYLELEGVKADIAQLKCSEIKQNHQFEALSEEICLLKTTKADQEAVQESLAEKANICDLAKKVSCEHFDAVCEDLTRNLNELMLKISQQETFCQQSLYKARCEIEEKIDNLEIPALKDFINCQLQIIKDKLMILSQMKQEQEAAGGRKILRNMRCIMCNKDVYMKTNSKLTVGSEPFPCRMNTKPYTTLKIYQERQERKMNFQGKNVLHLEKIMDCKAEKGKKCEENKENDVNQLRDQLCDRYCGGSHTILTSQQKVKKSKNDVNQYAYDLKLEEGFVKGTDGQIYRGRWIPKQSAVQT